jgi:hypothetical protein
MGVFFISILGVIAYKARQTKWNTIIIRRTRFAHKIVGYFAWYSTFYTLTSGMVKFQIMFGLREEYGYIPYSSLAAMISVYIILEV